MERDLDENLEDRASLTSARGQSSLSELRSLQQSDDGGETLLQKFSERPRAALDGEETDGEEDDWEWEEFVSQLEEHMPSDWHSRRPETAAVEEEEHETKRERLLKEQGGKTNQVIQAKKYSCNLPAETLRAPIVVILGHVDAGKTSTLDSVRHSKVQKGEAGGITQQIGATLVPLPEILQRTQEIRQRMTSEIKLPGLVFIDTPGHESFSNMRVRGSSLCDVAVLLVDMKHGLQATTIEALKLLRKGQTKFIVALNKVDRIDGWHAVPEGSIRDVLELQSKDTRLKFDERVKAIKAELSDHGVNASLYWRCADLDIQAPIVPISALDGCGIPDLLLFTLLFSQSLPSLQKRLTKTDELECHVLEIQQAQGLGTTMDVLLVNGILNTGDKLMLCGLNGPIQSQIRSLILAKPMEELKGKRDKNTALESHTKSVVGVRGVKIWAQDLDYVVAGSRLFVLSKSDNPDIVSKLVMQQLDSLKTRIQIGKAGGVRVHASTLGSLEALLEFLNENGVPIGSISLGAVHARDVTTIQFNRKGPGFSHMLLAFDVRVNKQAHDAAALNGVEILESSIIYQLLDQFKQRAAKHLAAMRESMVAQPCILAILPQYVLKEYEPIIIGVKVLLGSIAIGTRLSLLDGVVVGEIESIKTIESNTAVSGGGRFGMFIIQIGSWGGGRRLVYGRDIFEDDRFYTKIGRREYNDLWNDETIHKFIPKYRDFLRFRAEDDPPHHRRH